MAPDVLAKKEAAEAWCRHASDFARERGDKPWLYVLLPERSITENATLEGLLAEFRRQPTAPIR